MINPVISLIMLQIESGICEDSKQSFSKFDVNIFALEYQYIYFFILNPLSRPAVSLSF